MKRYILVVDHDVSARQATARMAELLGYHTINVDSADLALGVLKAVMIDVLLLGSLGADDDERAVLAAIARRAQPSIRVLVTDDRRLSNGGIPEGDACLAVPFSIQQLADALGRMRP